MMSAASNDNSQTNKGHLCICHASGVISFSLPPPLSLSTRTNFKFNLYLYWYVLFDFHLCMAVASGALTNAQANATL